MFSILSEAKVKQYYVIFYNIHIERRTNIAFNKIIIKNAVFEKRSAASGMHQKITHCFLVFIKDKSIPFSCLQDENRRRYVKNTGSPSSKCVVHSTVCVYKELYGKITDRKKIA